MSKINNPDKPSRSRPGRMLNAKTFIIAIILLSGLLNLNVPAHPIGTATPQHSIHFATAADPNNLGINCAYGALDATGLPITTEDGDGTLNTSCQWAGDVDGDTAPDPLVSDNPSTALAGSGGGFTADIIITSLDPSLLGINGFDQTISYDTHVLNAVLVDQSGLTFGGNLGCNPAINPSCTVTTALTIDRVGGTIRLAQAVLGITVGPGGSCSITAKPDCTSPTQTLFRIRFDVVGAGTGFIKFSTDPTKNVITQPASVPHTSQDGALGTDTFFSAINGVVGGTFEVNWTFSPSPEVPGKSLSFSAPSVTCTYCAGTLTYDWDFSSLDSPTYVAKVDATGMMATVTPPPPVIHRVTLTVTDGTHKASATRLLPLVVTANGPTTVAQGAPSTGFNGIWLGGVVTSTSGYSGLWRFCPGTNLNKLVCNTPSSAVSQSGASITQTSAVSSVTFNFAGLYNDFLSVSDTIVSQISSTANTGVAPVPVNVTGGTPAYTVTVSPSLTTINAGQSVDFTVSVVYAGTYPLGFKSTSFNYFFDFGDGSTNTVSSGTSVTFSHTFNLGGTFIVRVTPQETGNAAPNKIQENGYSSGITVIPPLAASFTFAPPLPTVGQTITFTPTVTGGNPPYSFAWDFGDGSTSTLQSPTHAYATAGPFTVALTVTDSTTPTPQTRKTSQMITVYPPAFDFSIAWSSTSASLTAGGSTAPNVVATLVSGTTASVACSVSLPSPAVAGLSAVPLAFSLMPSAAGASQAVAIATTSATPAGTYTISVSCAGGGVTRAPSTQFSLTVTAPVAVPTVTANSPTPNPANTGEMIMVTFTVTSTTTVTGITVDWGDGTTLDSLAGTATSDHHIYTSTGNLKSQTFTITVTATNTAGPGSGTTMATINDRPPTATISNVSPNPANIGQLVTITFATADPDGTVSSIAVDWGDGLAIDNLSGTATSDTHMYGSANSFTIMVTATDNSGSTGSATAGETVTSVTVTHVLLTFQVQAPQSPSRGPGNLQVFVNGQHVTDITLGLTFTGFGPIDITTFVISGGQNTVTFINPQTNQFNLVKNVTITQGDTILLRVIKTLKVSAGGTLNLTFSLPALATTSITVSSTSPLVGQTVTFTAKFTGGTAPFKCFFQFGDDESAVSPGTSGTCKATHDYDSSGTFTATIVIKGASKSDRVVAHLNVNVQEDDD